MYRLASESKPISTRILWDDTTRTFHVTCADEELLPFIVALAKQYGVRVNGDGSWTFRDTKGLSLGPEAFSERARQRIEWGVATNPHKDEPRPLVDQPCVVEQTSITGPERQRSYEQVGPTVTLTGKKLTDPTEIPASKPTPNSLRRLFGSRED